MSCSTPLHRVRGRPVVAVNSVYDRGPSLAPLAHGLCPTCESSGPIGEPCSERVCIRQGTHIIPEAEARSALRLPASQREPLVGQYVGDYLITGQLGRGGFGKVLLALQRPMFKLRAAVKLLEFEAESTHAASKILEKFRNEAGALAVLQHPNIVRLLQSGSHEGRPFMAMEYIAGSRTLQTEIARLALGHGALAPEVVRHLLEQLLNGLEAAHEQGLIHRDIKPENVMLQAVVGDPWHVKIVDFGLAKDIVANRETSMVLGTAFYMAPEQIEGKDLGPWTDVYAVGAIAFELLTGHRPFVGKEVQSVLRQKLNPQFNPFAHVSTALLEPTTVAFLEKALARFPKDRYPSAIEMRAALDKVFEAPQSTALFSRDLGALFDSGELARIKSEEARLADQRRILEDEWRRLEAEKRQLASDRVRLGSQEHGRPEDLEYGLHGKTGVVSVSSRVAPTIAIDVSLETTALPGREPVSQQTGVPRRDTHRRKGLATRGWWLGGASLALGTVAAVLVMPGNDAEIADIPPTVDLTKVVPDPPTGVVVEAQPTPAADVVLIDVADPDTAVDTTPEPPLVVAQETTLSITSTPEGAEVWVDGVMVGTTPFQLRTRVGVAHRIELRLAGRTTEVVEVVAEAESAPVALMMKPVSKPRPTTRPIPVETPPAPSEKPVRFRTIDDQPGAPK